MTLADDRLAALERQVAALTEEVARLRAPDNVAAAPRTPPPKAPSRPPILPHPSITGDEIESLVGRYGTLIFAALVILMGVGVLIKVAALRGLLTPEVRVSIGAIAAAGMAMAGLYFHRRGDVRYGNVLLALSLAMVDLVAWGAGPGFGLIPLPVALAIVDVVAVALVGLALRDESEFLFCVAMAGALSAPFVTSYGHGTAPVLLAYGAVVLVGALRAIRDARWWRAFAVLSAGALLYVFAAATMPMIAAWYAPFAIVLFGGACALGALLLAPSEWRGALARVFLMASFVGVPIGWDRIVSGPPVQAWLVALAIAGVTYAALLVHRSWRPLWTVSAVLLPFLSIGIASAVATSRQAQALVFGIWTVFALVAWQLERRRREPTRGGAHLLAGGLLGAIAVAELLWPTPFGLVAGLVAWGLVLAAALHDELSPLPLIAVAAALGSAALSALDQLASRQAYAYIPFMTRSSASALVATLGLGIAGVLIARAPEERDTRWADRPVRLGVVAAFAILWGRMEMAQAFSPDLSSFLLIAYYAACGLASIVAGRILGVQPLRLAGLTLAIYAAVKAVVEASLISGVLLRVGAYGAVGVFLLGAGYLYRERTARVEGPVAG
ncbi:MAG: DUF2339 domain-containing protein [Gemmatimonadaceae bacterium]